jgi:multiple sugar transport system substrate-binding protein
MKISVWWLLCILYAGAVGSVSDTLTIWIMPNNNTPEASLRKAAATFLAQHPHVHLNIEVRDWGQAWYRLTQLEHHQSGPDVVQVGTTWAPFFSDKGILLDLLPWSQTLPDSTAFLPALWSSTKRYNQKELTALPWFGDSRILMVNKKMFAQSKLDSSNFHTWHGLMQELKKFKRNPQNSHIWPLTYPGVGDWNVVHNFAPAVWSHGGSFLTKWNDLWFSNVNAPETRLGVEKYLAFALDSLVNPTNLSMNTIQCQQLFHEGKAFAFISNLNTLIVDSYNHQAHQDGILTFPIPGATHRYSFLGGSHLAVTAFSPRPQLAVSLLHSLTQPASQRIYFLETQGVPTLVHPGWELIAKEPAVLATIGQNLAWGRAFPPLVEWGNIEVTLKEHLENLLRYASGAFGPQINVLLNKELDLLDAKINHILGRTAPEIEQFHQHLLASALDSIHLVAVAQTQNRPFPVLLVSLVIGLFGVLVGIGVAWKRT